MSNQRFTSMHVDIIAPVQLTVKDLLAHVRGLSK